MFGNHYVRDSVGALEKQLEHQLHYTQQDYANLNSFYFFPNIVTPLFAGLIISKYTVSKSFLVSVMIASIGHFFFALGIQISSKTIVFMGRALAGSMYEIIDALLPIIYLGPLFQEEFQIVVGFMQIFIRMGSVVNFIISPLVYRHFGIKAAFWVASAIGCSSIPLFLLAQHIEGQYKLYLNTSSLPRVDGITSSTNSASNAEQSLNHVSYGQIPTEEEYDEESTCDEDETGGGDVDGEVGVVGARKCSTGLVGAGKCSTGIKYSTGNPMVDGEGSEGGDDGGIELSHLTSLPHTNPTSQNHTSNVLNKEASSTNANTNYSNSGSGASFSDDNYDKDDNSNSQSSSTCPDSSTNSSTGSNSLTSFLCTMFPLYKLYPSFYSYLLAGSFLYGSIVPFWFYGSKYLQLHLGLTVGYADGLMTIPEGMVVVLCLPLGLLVNKYQWTITSKLQVLAASQMVMCVSFICLVVSTCLTPSSTSSYDTSTSPPPPPSFMCSFPPPSPNPPPLSLSLYSSLPVLSLLLLGGGFSVSCSMYWGAIPLVVQPDLLSAASGIVSCAVNVLPSILPPLLAHLSQGSSSSHRYNGSGNSNGSGNVLVYVLALQSLLGSVCSLVCALALRREERVSTDQACSPAVYSAVSHGDTGDTDPSASYDA